MGGFCVLSGVLSEAEMVPLRQRLLEVSSRPEHSRAGIENAWSPADGLEAHPGGHVPAYIRHDLRWGETSLNPRACQVVDACFDDDWKIIYTTGTVNESGFNHVEWHSDG